MSSTALKQLIEKDVLKNISIDDYHARNELSFSGLSRFMQSPAHYRHYIETPQDPTPAQKFGQAAHFGILQPEEFYKNYAMMPDGIDRRTKDGKAKYEEFISANLDKSIISTEDYYRVQAMTEKVLSHPIAGPLLKNGVAERSFFWTDPVSGVECRCRPDFLRNDNVIVDLKTTEDASINSFQRSLSNYKYHIQSALYLEGITQALELKSPLTEFVHLVVEKNPPYGIGLYTLDDKSLAKASDEIREALDQYALCLKTGEWPGYVNEIQNISIPPWML